MKITNDITLGYVFLCLDFDQLLFRHLQIFAQCFHETNGGVIRRKPETQKTKKRRARGRRMCKCS